MEKVKFFRFPPIDDRNLISEMTMKMTTLALLRLQSNCGRELDPECRSFAFYALETDFPTHDFRQLLAD